jgi:dephospho-CoA kinase
MTTFRLGLTGSLGMGKSTTARMFADEGIPVWDADAAVHRLYGPGQPGAAAIRPLCPQAITPDGAVDRSLLRAAVLADPALLPRLDAAIHPLVAADRAAFLAATDAPIVLLDIPLLFEIGADRICDGVAVVSVPPDVQRARVLARPGMTEAAFATLLARQIPDAYKRARATWVIDTTSLDSARAAVRQILADIRHRQAHA